MSLVDKALRSKQNKERLASIEFHSDSEYDEFGMKIQDTSDYIVARILMQNPELYTDRDRAKIFNGKEEIVQNQANLYRLSRSRKPIAPNYQQIIWLRLLDIIPILDKNKVIVVPGLMWDIEKGELIQNGNARREVQK